MKALIILAVLLCSAPGHSSESWYLTPEDDQCLTDVSIREATGETKKQMHRARHVCFTKYGPRSPCLMKFEQVGPNDYKATCGAKR